MTILELTCRDPIIARDGRPFGENQGNRMRAVGWPLPSVVAGSLRTVVGKCGAREGFSPPVVQQLRDVDIAGVFPVADGKLFLPAPHDCVLENKDDGPSRTRIVHCVEPQDPDEGSGADWPLDGLKPVMLTNKQAQADFKPTPGPAWWPVSEYATWLILL